MKQIIEEYKQNIPIILIVIYSMGYMYLYTYYARFGIDIEYYINLMDIVFFTVKNIFFLLFVYLIFELIFRLFGYVIIQLGYNIKYYKIISNIKRNSIDKERILKLQEVYKIFDKGLERHYGITTFWLCIIFSLLILYYSEEYLITVSIAVPYLLTKFFMPQLLNKEKRKKTVFFYPVLLIASIATFGILGHKDGDSVKKGDMQNRIEYSTSNKIFTSEKLPIVLIGQTSSYVFIYNKRDFETTVISKDKLDYIKIEDPAIYEAEMARKAKIDGEKTAREVNEYLKKISLLVK
jgi:hypothetical protein